MELLRLITLATLLAMAAFAQTAEITGRLTDGTGAVVPNSRVTATNSGTGIRRDTTSNESGYFNIPNLQPGRYDLTIQANGFKPVKRSGIVLAVQQVARLDFSLEIGSLQEAVEVTGTAPLVESSNAALGHVIDNKRITDLPLNGRQFLEYALLGPGVNRGKPGDVRSAQQGIAISANGLYTKNNNFMLDGADNNESFQNQFVSEPSVDAIA
ncbi:MAG: carboxypeptidase-like regulatory domain-containing protein, partial [Bryobacteraceae bacterium]